MRKRIQLKDRDLFLLSGAGAIVLAFLGLSLAVTATGSARFAAALGYDAEVGYVVGAVFDIAKALLPVVLLALLTRRAFSLFAMIGGAWIGLVAYSALATHGTVSLAIANLERDGSWKMESRTNAKTELAAVERRLAVLSKPLPPRPTKSLLEAINGEKVPASVWRDSRECQNIRTSRYFRSACAKVLELRSELAAAEDYEKLEVRARQLRASLAETPFVATSDPLPEAFASTLGRLLKFDGRAGVALLLTAVIEIMSCFGFATLRALGKEQEGKLNSREEEPGPRESDKGHPPRPSRSSPDLDNGNQRIVLHASATRERFGRIASESDQGGVQAGGDTRRKRDVEPPSKVIPLAPAVLVEREGRSSSFPDLLPPSAKKAASLVVPHIADFIRDCIQLAAGRSLAAADLRAAYVRWCKAHGHTPLSQQRFGLMLAGLGIAKWKSCGLIRYRDIQLAA